jgi:[acyl-carrier-protein] S-malonyltransferase
LTFFVNLSKIEGMLDKPFEKAFLLFSGQGAQFPGMGLDLLEIGGSSVRSLFDAASAVMGRNAAALLGDTDTEAVTAALNRSDICQICVTLVNLASYAVLKDRGIVPAGLAGFSLGEYAALAVAGVLSAEDCFKLVWARGRAMQACCDALVAEAGGAGMAAIIGLSPNIIEEKISEWRIPGLYPANYNSPRQTVVSGTAAALAEAKDRFINVGAKRFIPLPVAGPFHSPLMQAAADAFAPALEATSFKDPGLDLYSNVSGALVTSGAEAKRLALLHITAPVRWTDELAAIQAAGGFNYALECGPGKALQGFWRDSGSNKPCLIVPPPQAQHEEGKISVPNPHPASPTGGGVTVSPIPLGRAGGGGKICF